MRGGHATDCEYDLCKGYMINGRKRVGRRRDIVIRIIIRKVGIILAALIIAVSLYYFWMLGLVSGIFFLW